AVIFPVADIDRALVVYYQAVRQVELVRLRLARLAPRRNQPAIGGKAMHAGVAVAVSHVQVARRGWDQLGGIVEGGSGAGDKGAGTLTPGVRVLAPLAQYLERFAIQGVNETHGIFPVGEIHDIIGNVDAMRIGEGPDTPATQVVAIAVEDQDWRLFAL